MLLCRADDECMRDARDYTSYLDVITQTPLVTADIVSVSTTNDPELQRLMMQFEELTLCDLLNINTGDAETVLRVSVLEYHRLRAPEHNQMGAPEHLHWGGVSGSIIDWGRGSNVKGTNTEHKEPNSRADTNINTFNDSNKLNKRWLDQLRRIAP